MKRGREEYVHELESDMASCLMLLSKVGDIGTNADDDDQFVMIKKESSGRVFKCRTCDREFPSFQALGGHRASHKKIPKLSLSEDSSGGGAQNPKPKTHECSICGVEFAIGQALGGHMRRHRQHVAENSPVIARDRELVLHDDHYRTEELMPVPVPVLKKSSSSKRVCLDMDLDLDLRLGPPGNHHNIYDLKLKLMSPTTVGC